MARIKLLDGAAGARFSYRPPTGLLPMEDIDDGYPYARAVVPDRDCNYISWLLGNLRLAFWEERYGVSPDKLIGASTRTRKWGWWIQHFWLEAQHFRPDPRWENALLRLATHRSAFKTESRFVRQVEQGKIDTLFHELMFRHFHESGAISSLLHDRPGELSWKMTRSMLDVHSAAEPNDEGRLRLLSILADRGHPALADEAIALVRRLASMIEAYPGTRPFFEGFESRYAERGKRWLEHGGALRPEEMAPLPPLPVSPPPARKPRPTKVRSVATLPPDADWPEDPRPPMRPEAEAFLADLIGSRTKIREFNYEALLARFLEAAIREDRSPSIGSIRLLLGKIGRLYPDMRSAMGTLFGPRADWIASKDPDWDRKRRGPCELTREEVVAILSDLPDLDPARGVVPLDPRWSEIPPEARRAAVAAIANSDNPSEADVPLLERLLCDPDELVRYVVRTALCRHPDSSFTRRMIARARRWFIARRTESGFAFEVRLPWMRSENTWMTSEIALEDAFDGVLHPRWEGMPVRQVDATALVSSIPLSYWCEEYGATPEELIRATMIQETETLGFPDLFGYAEHWQNAGWGEPLLRFALERPDPPMWQCAQFVPDEAFDALFEPAMRERGHEPKMERLLHALLTSRRSHATTRLTLAVLDYFRNRKDLRETTDVAIFASLAQCGHPTALNEFRDTYALLRKTCPKAMERLRFAFGPRYHLENYRLRHDLHVAFPTIPTVVGGGRSTRYGP